MVVVDSSVLILLCRIGKLNLLNKFFNNIIITKEIYNEIKEGVGSSDIEEGLKSWIHLDEQNFKDAENLSEEENIGVADASVILLTKEKKDFLMSNDYALITIARAKGIESWWLTGFLIKCLKKKIITKKEIKDILLELIKAGMRLDNIVYTALLKDIETYEV